MTHPSSMSSVGLLEIQNTDSFVLDIKIMLKAVILIGSPQKGRGLGFGRDFSIRCLFRNTFSSIILRNSKTIISNRWFSNSSPFNRIMCTSNRIFSIELSCILSLNFFFSYVIYVKFFSLDVINPTKLYLVLLLMLNKLSIYPFGREI